MAYNFFLSSDVDLPVKVKIYSMEGNRPKESLTTVLDDPILPYSGLYSSPHSDLYVSATLYSNGRALSPAVQTSYHPFSTQTRWSQWLTLPVKYKDLPMDAQLALTVWDVFGPRKAIAVGGTTVSLFGPHKTLLKGSQRLALTPGRIADGSRPLSSGGNKTPGITPETDRIDTLERLIKKYDKGDFPKLEWLDKLTFREIEKINQHQGSSHVDRLFLNVQFPPFPHPVLFQESDSAASAAVAAAAAKSSSGAGAGSSSLSGSGGSRRAWMRVEDGEASHENPTEAKHRKLIRSQRLGGNAKDLKPDKKEKAALEEIIQAPPTRALSSDDIDLLWKFRYALTKNRAALTKFVKCVDWSDEKEGDEALALVNSWAPMGVDDAMELLGPSQNAVKVRAKAVKRLAQADTEELEYYALQLVQALRYDAVGVAAGTAAGVSPLADLLIQRGIKSEAFAVKLFWFLYVERSDPTHGPMFTAVSNRFQNTLRKEPKGQARVAALTQQIEVERQLGQITAALKAQKKDDRKVRIAKLKEMLSPKGSFSDLSGFSPPISLPICPDTKVSGVIVEKVHIFKSALMPLGLHFSAASPSGAAPVGVLYKVGDDLRQDQLITQVIALMDRLLKKEGLDCKLTPYEVVATGPTSGMAELVPGSLPVATILSEYRGDIQRYLQKHAPASKEKFGIDPKVLDTFVRSCAGYSVITYLLGVGDRHLDNLMVTTKGALLHIDFGFILGRDPKPFPPPMKLSKEMVEAMGGSQSDEYKSFLKICCNVFLILRKSANLILSLFNLMVDANIPDIALDKEKALIKLQSNFKLELNDEEAVAYIQSLINTSVSALFPKLVEVIHSGAQYLRS